MENKISGLSKLLLLAAAVLLIVSLFVPLWSIYLDAPQYPEGLKLEIWPNKIAGDVDIINGLNHYIGMKTLKTSDFIEFTVFCNGQEKMAVYCVYSICTVWNYCHGRFLEMGA
jgi:copper chaperone NosL